MRAMNAYKQILFIYALISAFIVFPVRASQDPKGCVRRLIDDLQVSPTAVVTIDEVFNLTSLQRNEILKDLPGYTTSWWRTAKGYMAIVCVFDRAPTEAEWNLALQQLRALNWPVPIRLFFNNRIIGCKRAVGRVVSSESLEI